MPEPRSSSFKFSSFTVTDEDTEAASSALDTAVEGKRERSRGDEMVDEWTGVDRRGHVVCKRGVRVCELGGCQTAAVEVVNVFVSDQETLPRSMSRQTAANEQGRSGQGEGQG